MVSNLFNIHLRLVLHVLLEDGSSKFLIFYKYNTIAKYSLFIYDFKII